MLLPAMIVLERISHRIAVTYLGEIDEIGPHASVFEQPTHPYTKKLMAAVPIPEPKPYLEVAAGHCVQRFE